MTNKVAAFEENANQVEYMRKLKHSRDRGCYEYYLEYAPIGLFFCEKFENF